LADAATAARNISRNDFPPTNKIAATARTV